MALRYQDEILSGFTWSLMCLICTVILTAVARMMVKISAAKTLSKAEGKVVVESPPKTNLTGGNCFGKDDRFSLSGKIKPDIGNRKSSIGKLGRIHRSAINDSGEKNKTLKGPFGLPVFGSLHLLAGPGGPCQAFTELSRKYGEIYALKLGSSSCVVVSSYRLVKEVLVTKGDHFGGRPDIQRFRELFGGDRNNSLAFCDWSDLQRTRRSVARSYCSPRSGSAQRDELRRVASTETSRLLEFLGGENAAPILRGEEPFKPLLLAAVANMFTHYICSSWFGYADSEFRRTVRVFDEIFWDINQGYAVDFLPWLGPLYASHMRRLRAWTTEIRGFILERIVNGRRATLDVAANAPRDFTDALLLHFESPETSLSWDHVIFELEDLIAGHTAVGNLTMLVLAHVVMHPEVQARVHEECDAVRRRRGSRFIDLNDRPQMPYTEAVIWETVRVASSPIIPHVATRDTDVDGYPVPKDTVVFVNNYELNLGEDYWGPEAREFRPERFLVRSDEPEESWRLVKPAHFIPFSIGKRTCIGQRLVHGFTFATFAAIVADYRIYATENESDLEARLVPGCIAVPPDTFHLVLEPRNEANENPKTIARFE